MDKKILFRADGNSEIGLGHLVRLLALHNMICNEFNCTFLTSETSAIDILTSDVRTLSIPENISIEDEPKWIGNNFSPDEYVIIADGYFFRSQYQQDIKKLNFTFIYIDDLHSFPIYADLIINHTEGIIPNDYSSKSGTLFCLGTKYALLRSAFLNSRQIKKWTPIKKAFLSLGGSDPNNHTISCLVDLVAISDIEVINIVIGASYPFYSDLLQLSNEYSSKNKEINIHRNIDEHQLFALMMESQIGVTSSSNISYEFCSIGGLLFVIQTADNQKDIDIFLKNNGLAFDYSLINAKLFTKELHEIMSNNQTSFFDGKSGERIKKTISSFIKEPFVKIRQANESDMLLFLEWANDSVVRYNAVNQNKIVLEDHEKWFNERINDKFMFVIEYMGLPIGQIRFDSDLGKLLITYSITTPYRGLGIGTIALKKTIEIVEKETKKTIAFKALVRPDNLSSRSVFSKLGFKRYEPVTLDSRQFDQFILN